LKLLPFPTLLAIDTKVHDQSTIPLNINVHFSALPLRWSWDDTNLTGTGFAPEDVWSRKARQRRAKQEFEIREAELGATRTGRLEAESSLKAMTTQDEAFAAIGFRVTVVEDSVELRWLKGVDLTLWESLCGNMTRLVAPPPPPATSSHTTNTDRKRRQRERKRKEKKALRSGVEDDVTSNSEFLEDGDDVGEVEMEGIVKGGED
jgi:hypothetical protein